MLALQQAVCLDLMHKGPLSLAPLYLDLSDTTKFSRDSI